MRNVDSIKLENENFYDKPAGGGAGGDNPHAGRSTAKQTHPPRGGAGVGSHGIGLYIHIPFCKSKCYYCDFNSYAGKSDCMPAYFSALKREIGLYSDKLADYHIKTVFIGGGTPSLADPRYIEEIMEHCIRNFDLLAGAEISIETNPGTLSYEKLLSYRKAGINRLSMGLQAWQDRILAGIGRIHSSGEFVENFKEARRAGFDNINVDLIFGLPGQTAADWSETLERVVELGPEHISCYSLKIEEDTVFGKRLEKGELIPAEDELDREMYYMAINRLGSAGYGHYEISNFAKSGYECQHNLIYWKAEQYIGIGTGAHSYLEGERFNNINGIDDYMGFVMEKGMPIENVQVIDRKDEISEFIILGLRLTKGIDTGEFTDRFNEDIFRLYRKQIDELVNKGLLKIDGSNIRLTPRGLDMANEVFVEFI